MKLYAVKKFGSAIVELALEESNTPCEIKFLEVADIKKSDYLKVNPLGQIPTLELDNGEIITESLAICTYIAKDSRLIPKSTAPEYPAYLRWSTFLVSSIYSLAPYADHPDWYVSDQPAQAQLKEATMKRVQDRFLQMEQVCKAPYFLGERLTLIDLFIAVMSFWEPRREWFDKHCPKLMANTARYQATPIFKKVFARNE